MNVPLFVMEKAAALSMERMGLAWLREQVIVRALGELILKENVSWMELRVLMHVIRFLFIDFSGVIRA